MPSCSWRSCSFDKGKQDLAICLSESHLKYDFVEGMAVECEEELPHSGKQPIM